MKIGYKINKHTVNFGVSRKDLRQIFTSYGRVCKYVEWTTELCILMGKIESLFSTKEGEHWVDAILAPDDTEGE